jgi:hypothetical protein
MKQGCKVYKRAGITHVCYKGFHYAPPDGKTNIDTKGHVDLEDASSEKCVVVAQSDGLTEVWVQTVIGNDNPKGYALGEGKEKSPKKAKEPKEEKLQKKTGAILKLLTPEREKELGLPSADDVDKMLQIAAPNTDALSMLRVCWSNWLQITAPGNRNLTPFSEFLYEREEDTLRVHLLGAKLADLFKSVYSR